MIFAGIENLSLPRVPSLRGHRNAVFEMPWTDRTSGNPPFSSGALVGWSVFPSSPKNSSEHGHNDSSCERSEIRENHPA